MRMMMIDEIGRMCHDGYGTRRRDRHGHDGTTAGVWGGGASARTDGRNDEEDGWEDDEGDGNLLERRAGSLHWAMTETKRRRKACVSGEKDTKTDRRASGRTNGDNGNRRGLP